MESALRTGMNHMQLNDDDRFDRLEALIRSEIGGLRAEMVSELGGVKSDLGEVKTDAREVKAGRPPSAYRPHRGGQERH